jgi:phenylacetate-CoA ligase
MASMTKTISERSDDRSFPPYLLEHIETMSRADLERLQERRLLRQIAFTYARGALTRKVWDEAGVHPSQIKSLDDYRAKAPFINKDSIRQFRDDHGDPSGGVDCTHSRELVGIGTTSGTTGDPTPLPRTSRAVSDMMSLRDYWRIGVRPGDYIAHMLFIFRGGIAYRSIREHNIIPIHFTHSPHELKRLFQAIPIYRPTLLRNVSNPMLLAIEEMLNETGEDPRELFRSFKGAIFGGEPLGSRQKRLADEWGLEIFEQTTLGDICPATECTAHAGMHVHEDVAFTECLDPDGDTPVKDGEVGELVVTSLADRAVSLIRYRTDDLVRIDRTRCACGVTHARMHVLGRKGDQIIVNGVGILPRQVQEVVEGIDEARAGLFQIIRTDRVMDALRVRIGFDSRLLSGSPEDFAARAQAILTAKVGVPTVVTVTPNEELLKLGPPHKIPRVAKS